MNSRKILDQHIQLILKTVEFESSDYGEVDTCRSLHHLASTSEWSVTESGILDFLCKRLDISNKFYLGYDADGKKTVETVLTDKNWLNLAVAILVKAVFFHDVNMPPENQLKRFNVLFKALDINSPEWLSPDSILREYVDKAWNSLLQKLPAPPDTLHVTSPGPSPSTQYDSIKQIPLAVLFYEGPIARAYLETIRSLGFQPEKIIELIPSRDLSTRKKLGKWLPSGLRKNYIASIQRSKIHYWPKQIRKVYTGPVENIEKEIADRFLFSQETLSNARSLLPLTTYCNDITSLIIDGLDDSRLKQCISGTDIDSLLFTGGGLVPASLTGLHRPRLLHIHPGHLPDIRGADCVLWSTLLTGHTSASCFYMAPGIDTGDIIKAGWLPGLSFNTDLTGLDSRTLYRMVYGFIDPWVRAYILREVVSVNTEFNNVESVRQDEETGTTYHFMHDKMKDVAFKRLFR